MKLEQQPGTPSQREIIERHGGSISVESKYGEVAVTVVLPVRGEDM